MNPKFEARNPKHFSDFGFRILNFGDGVASEIKLPELGENLTGGDVLDVRVAAGDTVSQGQTLVEIEAEKATVEVPAPEAGRITELRVKKGDHVEVGQTLCLIEGADGQQESPKTEGVREADVATKPSESDGRDKTRVK